MVSVAINVCNKIRYIASITFGILEPGNTEMDMFARCRAMAAFCRQHARFEDEDDAFWTREAEEWDKLITEHPTSSPQNRAGQTAEGREHFS